MPTQDSHLDSPPQFRFQRSGHSCRVERWRCFTDQIQRLLHYLNTHQGVVGIDVLKRHLRNETLKGILGNDDVLIDRTWKRWGVVNLDILPAGGDLFRQGDQSLDQKVGRNAGLIQRWNLCQVIFRPGVWNDIELIMDSNRALSHG